jgi:hypothetical protein
MQDMQLIKEQHCSLQCGIGEYRTGIVEDIQFLVHRGEGTHPYWAPGSGMSRRNRAVKVGSGEGAIPGFGDVEPQALQTIRPIKMLPPGNQRACLRPTALLEARASGICADIPDELGADCKHSGLGEIKPESFSCDQSGIGISGKGAQLTSSPQRPIRQIGD